MFEDSLLIIKHDYISKRKLVLQKLLEAGFLMQATRNIQFTPELAVEFLKGAGIPEDSHFMSEVITLSKGYSEAVVVTKENAVEDLWCTLVCFFGTTQKMEPNVYVSKCHEIIRKDISYIFPNYIQEPISIFDQYKFRQQPFIKLLIGEMFDIVQSDTCHWKVKLAEWLALNNRMLPHVSNVCSTVTALRLQDKAQQTSITVPKDQPLVHHPPCKLPEKLSSSEICISSPLTSSSCISCSSFTSTCPKPPSSGSPYPAYPEMPERPPEPEPEPKPSTPSYSEEDQPSSEEEEPEEEEWECSETPPGGEEEEPEEPPPEEIVPPPEEVEPVEPVEPEEPEVPEEPEETLEPEVPTEPEVPAEPQAPAEPEEPTEPDEPAKEGLIDLGDGEMRIEMGGTVQTGPLEDEPIRKNAEEAEMAAGGVEQAAQTVEQAAEEPGATAAAEGEQAEDPAEGEAAVTAEVEGEAPAE